MHIIIQIYYIFVLKFYPISYINSQTVNLLFWNTMDTYEFAFQTRRNNGRVISASGSSYKCYLLMFDLTRDNAHAHVHTVQKAWK